MLISKKDISAIQPPFLMQVANGGWQLVIKVVANTGFDLEVVEKENDTFIQRVISQEEPPFYVGEDVWELNYGATLMTLNHASLKGHPASQLWEDWNKSTRKA